MSYEVEADGSVVLSVYVQPSAARAGVVGRHGESLKVRVTSPPEGGKANVAVCRLLAGELGVRRGDAELVRGHTSRTKQVRIRNVELDRVRTWLAHQT